MGLGVDDGRQVPSAADAAAARKTRVRPRDLLRTSGWTGVMSSVFQPGGFGDSCTKVSDLVETGRAFSQWSRGAPLGDPAARNVFSFTRLYRTPGMARLHRDRVMTRKYNECSGKPVGETHLTVEEVSASQFGAASRVLRVSYTYGGYHRVSELVDVVKGRAELRLSETVLFGSSLSALHADAIRLAQLMLSRAP